MDKEKNLYPCLGFDLRWERSPSTDYVSLPSIPWKIRNTSSSWVSNRVLPTSTVQVEQTLALVPLAILACGNHLADHDGMISHLQAFLPYPAAAHPPLTTLAALQPRLPFLGSEGAGFNDMGFLRTGRKDEFLR